MIPGKWLLLPFSYRFLFISQNSNLNKKNKSVRRQERKKIRPNYFKHEAMDRSIVNINNNQRRDKSGGVRGGSGGIRLLVSQSYTKNNMDPYS